MRNDRVHLCIGCLLGLFLGFVPQAVADPVITGITGTLDNGASVTIQGSGFLDGTFEPFSWDDFDNGTAGQELGTPIVGPDWSFLSQTPRPSYSATRTHSGEHSAHITWPNYSISAFGWSNKGPFDRLYISFWRYMDPEDPDTPPLNFKMMYLHGNGTLEEQSDSPHFMIGAIMPTRRNWQFAVQNHPTVNFPWQTSRSYFETINVWQRWEIYVQLESSINASDGYIEGWLDGVKVYEQGGLNLADSDGTFRDFRLGHMFQGHGQDDHCYYDDVYVSQSRSRIEIGNAPSFEACTVREIQIPTDWSSNLLTVDLHYSRYSQGELAYLYVVDDNGVVNTQGYPIVMGEGGMITDEVPNVQITSPISSGTYETTDQHLTLSGWASDDSGLIDVLWVNNAVDNGIASNDSGDWTAWTAADIVLEPGTNTLQIYAIDLANQLAVGTLTVEYTPIDPGPPGVPGQPATVFPQ